MDKTNPVDGKRARADRTLTRSEVRLALARGVFTITTETARGYYVTVFGKKNGHGIVRLSQSAECVRPRTARRYATKLVREALRAGVQS